MSTMCRNIAIGLECGHTPHSGGGDRLATDLEGLGSAGVNTLVSLLDEREANALGLDAEGAEAAGKADERGGAAGMTRRQLRCHQA